MLPVHRISQNATRIARPLERHGLSDATPHQVFRRLRQPEDFIWLDGGEAPGDGETWSYLFTRPAMIVKVAAGQVFIHDGAREETKTCNDAWDLLKGLFQAQRIPRIERPGEPPFCGGWVGSIAYPTESVQRRSDDVGSEFDILLGLFDSALCWSSQNRQWWHVHLSRSEHFCDAERDWQSRLDRFIEQIAPLERQPAKDLATPRPPARSNMTRAEYCNAVERALGLIAAGDIYQINLAQKFSIEWPHSAADFYERFRAENPARYGAFFGSSLLQGQGAICSLSPELFLRVRGRKVVTRPIKGTRPRSGDPVADAQARGELSASVKERAELNMIVDLERNDLGRVCEYGSVRVESAGEIEELPTLFHRVATVTGTLHPDCDAADLLRAAFPGGSVTGTPKLRAMQIINELEPCPRGPYCGAIGWIGCDGDMELSIAIRTALFDPQQRMLHYHAGSGIVADSVPQLEYEETLHKAAAFLRAAGAWE